MKRGLQKKISSILLLVVCVLFFSGCGLLQRNSSGSSGGFTEDEVTQIGRDSEEFAGLVQKISWTCPDCGRTNQAALEHCPICGAEKPAS
ncbi:MAG TPA: hypothetical protein IAD19_00155 [Candidatus Egerieicola faecale]|uniref:RanBP2-type domain-containing protein n=1 Tax=Candidatus Egerieicola faecale TaxID=2840774 RepID=A0A9D1IQM8_9FIRM|nr:hypothetical protein [Candidatus Egerieicola faecale]